MERGDTGLGRDAYGLPRRERDRRGYGPYSPDDHYSSPDDYEEDDAAGPGRPVDVEEDDYGQLLRRPGEMPPRQRLRQPGRPLPGQPGRYPPGAPPNGGPGHGGGPGAGGSHGAIPHAGSPNGPPHAGPPNGAPHAGPANAGPYAGPPNGGPHAGPPNGGPHAGPPNGGPHSGPPNGGPYAGAPNGGPGPNGGPPGRQYRLPNGRRVPPNPDRLYRPPGPSMPGGTSGRHHGPGPGAPDSYAASWSRPGPAPGAPPPGGHGPGGAGGHVPGGPVPGGPVPGGPVPGGPVPGGPVPGGAIPGGAIPGGAIPGGAPPYGGHGRERLGPPPEPPGPVIRQREAAVPEQPGGAAQPVASIAPDGLEAFARDLRALRAKANLDYPEMAEVSHYEMKTLAAAAGGLRLPTLPVAVAFVRACDGNVAEWEERWQKIAEKIAAETSRKRRNEDEEDTGSVEPAEAPAALEGPAGKPATAPPDSGGGEVYVITSAKPRQPGW